MPKVPRSFFRKLISSFFFFSQLLHANSDDFKKLWFSGSIEEALAQAKREKKPILLYWGAVWCPPCNVLKSQIFNKPEFLAMTEPLIRVYLDGDTEAAQKWGDTLHASGYPTLLLLSSEGKELFRIANSINWDELKDTLEAALEAQGSFEDALQAAQTEGVPRAVWKLLAYTHWYHEDASASEKTKMLAIREKLIERIPTELESEKALLVSGLLEELVDTGREDSKAAKYMNVLLATRNTVWASRDFLVNGASSLIKWLKKNTGQKEFAELCLRWIRATEFIRTRTLTSPDLRLWSLYPHLLIAREFSPDKKTTVPAIKSAIIEAVQLADKEAKTSFERHSVVSGAAELLSEVGEVEASRKLLLKELKKTDTPWYYQSSLARLEEKQGNTEQALVWSHLAKESAKGNATRLQWIVSDLLMNLRLAPENSFAVNKLVREYYDFAFSLPDGFKGRNARRAKSVSDALSKLENKEAINETLSFYMQRCRQNSKENAETCKKLFAFSSPSSQNI